MKLRGKLAHKDKSSSRKNGKDMHLQLFLSLLQIYGSKFNRKAGGGEWNFSELYINSKAVSFTAQFDWDNQA